MKIGFYTVFRHDPQHYALAQVMLRSIRRVMPDVEIVQFTDETSPAVHGVDSVRRKSHGRMLERRLEHYADCHGDWLLLDTDTKVQRDVCDVFEHAFDVALADRHWPHLPATPELTAKMPYNTGVVFCRKPEFWQAVLRTWRAYPKEQQDDWMSEQQAVADVLRTTNFKLLVLPGMTYNYPPLRKNDPAIASCAIAHYKGDRKSWMRDDLSTPAVVSPRISEPLRIFIGYDPRQPVAFHVAAHSIWTRSSVPVSITRLQLSQLPLTRRGLTEFTYSRFMVPWLSGFAGRSLFVDADVLCLGDIAELFQHATTNEPVHVVQGPHRFEWPSLMLFDNAQCQQLTPAYVQDPEIALFKFPFTKSIGSLPAEWNHLVGYDTPRMDAKLVHFTQGIPTWPETQACEYGEEWRCERDNMLHTVGFSELMGASVHVKHMK